MYKKKTKQKKKSNESECVIFILFMNFFLYDKIARIKKNLIFWFAHGWRIMNLHVSCIFNIRWKNIIFKTFLTHQVHEAWKWMCGLYFVYECFFLW